MEDSAPILQFRGVTLGYGRKAVLRGVNLEIRGGDYLGIVGPNGAGKTTLLKAILGMVVPLAGMVTASEGRRHFGYVPQLQDVDEVIPLTVFEIAQMGRYGRLGALRRPGAADRRLTLAALDEMGIGPLKDSLFRDLSGGQKQRALIARALAGEPDVLVLDEPTNNMDVAGEKSIMALVDRLHAERHLSIVIVSHLLHVVINHVERVGLVGDGALHVAATDALLKDESWLRMYGIEARIREVEGVRVVV